MTARSHTRARRNQRARTRAAASSTLSSTPAVSRGWRRLADACTGTRQRTGRTPTGRLVVSTLAPGDPRSIIAAELEEHE